MNADALARARNVILASAKRIASKSAKTFLSPTLLDWRYLRYAKGDVGVVARYCKTRIGRGELALSPAAFRKIGKLLRYYHILLSLPEVYQPVTVAGLTHLKARRPCADRLALISADMRDPPGTVNDIGCQIGFFSFSLASRGYAVTGYDMDARCIAICRGLNDLSDIPVRPTFEHTAFLPETVSSFLTADYTLCLAVFHHIIYYHGLPTAQKLVPILRGKTRKKLYFEIGQSNEPVEPWARHMPDMGTDPLAWITDFLKGGGFEDVRVLGIVPTHVSEVPRYLVVAS